VLAVLVTAIIGWALKKFTDKTHIEIEAKHRDALHSAAMTGVHLAITRLGAVLSNVTIDTRSAIIAQATNWVLASVPDALTYLGVTKDSVEQLVQSKLNAVLIGNASAAAAPATGG
jgi:hypothetical protein